MFHSSVTKYLLFISVIFVVGQPTATKVFAATPFETRCGWFSNPTPSNAFLSDRHGEWIIGLQGGHQAKGDWPNFKQQWMVTNYGGYGYGCACLRVRANHQNRKVLEIKNSYAKPLAACRKDRSLKEPN